MYASPAAYQSHLQSEHFKKYKTATTSMVKSLRLIETEPLVLGTK
jgi:quinol monooxygenase YgiN